MKVLHISDLHFGKSIYGLSMIESKDQAEWCRRFLQLCDVEKPQAVLISGDVYDRNNPSGNAVELLSSFLTELSKREITVLMIAGNHDSGQRLAFAEELLSRERIEIAGKVQKEIRKVTLQDEFGPVNFWLIPYIYPEIVRTVLDEEVDTYEDAMRKLLEKQEVNFEERNIVLAHQNITANGIEVELGGSESMVGGVGQIDYSVFDGFDYVALGHIHRTYPVGRKEVMYAGTPLCYHFDETKQKERGPIVVTIGEKGTELEIRQEVIEPLHKVRRITGTKEGIYAELKDDPGREEYVSILITDQRKTPEINQYLSDLLRSRGSVPMEILSDFKDFSVVRKGATSEDVEKKSLEELFTDLYQRMNEDTMPTEEEEKMIGFVAEITRNRDCHEEIADDDEALDRIIEFAKKLGEE